MKKPRRPREPKDKGAALVMVLWGAVVMSIVAAAAARQASTSAVVVNVGAELTRARALADGGVRLGWSAFADHAINSFDPTWACRNADDVLLVRIRSETSRIDLNASSGEMLFALYQAAGVDRTAAERLAEATLAYRSFGEGSAENEVEGEPEPEDAPEQMKAGQFMRGPFQTIEELGYVQGMDVSLFRTLADDVSVHSRSSDIELRFASDMVKEAVSAVARTEGLMVGASEDATPGEPNADGSGQFTLPAFEGSLLNVRAIAVTGSGAVFVRDAVVEGPFDPNGKPKLLRFVQGRLKANEAVPVVRDVVSCAQGFTAMRLAR